MAGPFGPFGAAFERLGDVLINRVVDSIFGTGGAVRSTLVVIFNHSNHNLFYLTAAFGSGGFTPGAQPGQIAARSIVAYRVESHGLATGVTDADVRFGFAPSDADHCLRIVTSNPFIGSNHAEAHGYRGLTVTCSYSVGNHNQVDVDVY